MTARPCVLFTAHWFIQIWNIVQWCGPHIQRETLISWKEYREERLNLSWKVMIPNNNIRLKKSNLTCQGRRGDHWLMWLSYIKYLMNKNIGSLLAVCMQSSMHQYFWQETNLTCPWNGRIKRTQALPGLQEIDFPKITACGGSHKEQQHLAN